MTGGATAGEPLNVFSVFSGIGGLELGLERAGMNVVAQVEMEPFPRAVLNKHWPEVPKHDYVQTCLRWWGRHPRPPVHVVAGGFPCQPFSEAGRRRGVADERWGWPWMFDVVRGVQPRWVVFENVAELLNDTEAFGWILGDLAEAGFDAEWGVLSACSVGASHPRERLFVVAYAPGERVEQRGGLELPESGDQEGDLHQWVTQPEPRRVAHGVPDRMDRLSAIGNAVVPQVGEHIGRMIVAAERRSRAAA